MDIAGQLSVFLKPRAGNMTEVKAGKILEIMNKITSTIKIKKSNPESAS